MAAASPRKTITSYRPSGDGARKSQSYTGHKNEMAHATRAIPTAAATNTLRARFIDLTTRMSHEEERVNGARMRYQPQRAPRHWLNPLVGPVRAALRLQVRPYPRGRLRRRTPLSFSHAEPAV